MKSVLFGLKLLFFTLALGIFWFLVAAFGSAVLHPFIADSQGSIQPIWIFIAFAGAAILWAPFILVLSREPYINYLLLVLLVPVTMYFGVGATYWHAIAQSELGLTMFIGSAALYFFGSTYLWFRYIHSPTWR